MSSTIYATGTALRTGAIDCKKDIRTNVPQRSPSRMGSAVLQSLGHRSETCSRPGRKWEPTNISNRNMMRPNKYSMRSVTAMHHDKFYLELTKHFNAFHHIYQAQSLWCGNNNSSVQLQVLAHCDMNIPCAWWPWGLEPMSHEF